jgi:hypothetical protein
MNYRVFNRVCWRPDPSYPDGYAPNPVPMDECRTIDEFETTAECVEFCDERNEKWRKHTARVRTGTATATQRRTYYTAPRYEFTAL